MFRYIWICLSVCVVTPALFAEEKFFFQKEDRIVFLGDSITEQYQYSSYMELYLTTRFPKWNLQFLNAGIGGDTANGGALRFQGHVLEEKPTCITINFGMNDAGYGAFNAERHAVYTKQTEAMLDAAKKAGVRVALLSPNAVDRRIQERFKLYVETQKEFYAPLKELAAKYGASFVDQYAKTRAAVEKMEADKADSVKPYYDGFHTAPPGGLLMAHAILTGLYAPAKVSDLKIDVTNNQAKTEQCTVENLKATTEAITFTRQDEALPMPVQKEWVSLLPYVNHLNDLNYYGLTITGLNDGKYTVNIDGKEVGQWTNKELAEGINLGNVTTGPIYEQSQKVLQAITDKNRLVHQRFRGVVMFTTTMPDWLKDLEPAIKERQQVERKKRLDQITEKQTAIYKLTQPVAHTFEVKKVK